MAVTLIIEDGSIVADANSFVDVIAARAYAEARNTVLSPDDDVVTTNLFLAAEFLNSLEPRFAGQMTSAEQEMVFPRIGVPFPKKGYVYSRDEIPPPLVAAQIELSVSIQNGANLYTGAGGAASAGNKVVKRRKIGPIETEYQDSATNAYASLALMDTLAAVSPVAYSLLSPLFGSNGRMQITTVRQ